MSKQALEALEQALEARIYRGNNSSVGLHLPPEGIKRVTGSLDLLKDDAPIHYALVEDNTSLIQSSDDHRTYVRSGKDTIYLARKILSKNRAYRAVALVHEAKHIELDRNGHPPWEQAEQDYICFETEADCIEELGMQYWHEMNLGFAYDRQKYLDFREAFLLMQQSQE